MHHRPPPPLSYGPLSLQPLTPPRRARVVAALNLLRRHAPWALADVFRELVGVSFLADACDGGVACTGGRFQRWAILAKDPVKDTIIEIALSLYHESLHHGRDRWGEPVLIQHFYAGAPPDSDLWHALYESDPIVQAEQELRAQLVTSIEAERQRAHEFALAQQAGRRARTVWELLRDALDPNGTPFGP